MAGDSPRAGARSGRAEWIGAITGTLALIISTTVAYFSIIRQVDDLRVFVHYVPLAIDWTKGEVRPSDEMNLSLINAGNRGAAVLGVDLALRETANASFECSGLATDLSQFTFSLSIGPTIIKGGEIVVLRGKAGKQPASAQEPAPLKLSRVDGKSKVTICIRFHLVTPDNETYDAVAPGGETTFWRNGDTVHYIQFGPFILVKRSSTIFGL